MSDPRRVPGALLLVLACALVGHLWMQSAGAHPGPDPGADPVAHSGGHGQDAAGTGAGADAVHQMAAGCIAVLAVVALLAPRGRAVVRQRPAPQAAVGVTSTTSRQQPGRPPGPPRAPVDQGVLLRV